MNANKIILRNNTGNKDKTSLIEGFIVRTKIFNNIFSELQTSKLDKPEQNYLIIGPRGTGKTTLLYRLKYAIEDDKSLNKWIIPIMFSEEQYGITELENLWESVGEQLEDIEGWHGISKEINAKYSISNYYEEKASDILQDWLKKHNKRVILFLENINSFFKKIGDNGQQRLREVLTTSPYIVIIGSATSFFDGVIDYSKPFYDFFKTIQLEGLSKEETEKLLIKIGEQHHSLKAIQKVIELYPERIESLRRLTSGIPRTISYLFQIFMDNENGKAIKDLYQLLDDLSLLYKAELDQLSIQQQKIIDVIAKKWDYISVKEIASKTRLESKHVSSILKQLEKNQIIEIIPTDSKNHLYGLRDRFLNIWYLMRFGKKSEKEKVQWLVRFYDVWCDKAELTKRISRHIQSLKKGQYDEFAAINMGNTFLSCQNIPLELKYNLYVTTKSILPKDLIKSVSITDGEMYKISDKFIKNKEYEKSLKALEQIENHDKYYYTCKSLVYFKLKDHSNLAHSLENLYVLDPAPVVAYQIGIEYERYLKNFEKADKYYQIALKDKYYDAAHRLGHLYYEEFNNPTKSEEYYRIAIKNKINRAIVCLATMFSNENKNIEAEELFRLAINKKLSYAHNKLGLHYIKTKELQKAEEEFKNGMEENDEDATVNYGISLLSRDKPNYKIATNYFKKLTSKNNLLGEYLLGRMYHRNLKDFDKAEKHLILASAKADLKAIHELAHVYEKKKEYNKSDELFIKLIEQGEENTILCFINSVFANYRSEKKEFLLNYLRNHEQKLEEVNPVGFINYAIILLWNNEIEQSIKVLKSQYENISEEISSSDEDQLKELIEELLIYFILLIAKGQYNAAIKLFEEPNDYEIYFKDMLKPLYIYLLKIKNKGQKTKIPSELKETVIEIDNKVEQFKLKYN